MLARKPPMLVIVALANKNARVAWALIAKGGNLPNSGRDRVGRRCGREAVAGRVHA